jgi:transposase
MSIAAEMGRAPQTLNDWGKRAEVDNGRRAGVPTGTAEKMKALERENRNRARRRLDSRLRSSIAARSHGGFHRRASGHARGQADL